MAYKNYEAAMAVVLNHVGWIVTATARIDGGKDKTEAGTRNS